MKRIIAAALAVLLIVLSVPVMASEPLGTASNPYRIASAADLNAVHNDLDGYYILTADINMSGTAFTPIGNQNEGAFSGTIDGNGHKIYNLDLDLPGGKYVGLVGYLEGTVKNLTVENTTACGYHYVGIIAGIAEEGSCIENCHVSGNASGVNIGLDPYVGGVVGYLSSGTVTDCVNEADIVTETMYAGGIVGYNSGTIGDCENCGTVSASTLSSSSSYAHAGGITGYNSGAISDCVNCGTVSSSSKMTSSSTSDSYAGGITGKNSGTISDCVNYEAVSASSSSQGSNYYYSGGIAGYNYNSIINNCVNYGDISRGSSSSGLLYTQYYGSGGIVGEIRGSSKISTCTNYGVAGKPISSSFSDCTYVALTGTNTTLSFAVASYTLKELSTSGNITADALRNSTLKQLGLSEDVWFIDPATNSGFPQLKNLPRHMVLNECLLLMNVGGTASLTAYLDGMTEAVTWTSSDEKIAHVSADGTVTALAQGDVVFTAENSEGMKAVCIARITKTVENLTMAQSVTLNIGSSTTLSAAKTPADSTEVINWSSSNTSVATVSGTGNVSAKSVGTAVITAECQPSGVSASCTVHVIGKPITSLSLPSTATVNKGTPAKLNLSVSPSPYSGTVTWSSADETVATVSDDGTVSGLRAGSTVISAVSDTGKSANCTVTVKIPSERIELASSAVTIIRGMTEKLSYTLYPADTTDSVSWSTSSSSYATVASDGTVTASGSYSGTATITATTTSGKKAYCVVTVTAAPIPVTSVTLNKTELVLSKADKSQLTAAVLPSNATNKSLTWTSTDEKVVTVSDSGVVTAVGEGSAVVTVSSDNGFFAECVIKVISASGMSVVLSDSKASPGETALVKANIVKNSGISAYRFTVGYDASVLTPTAVIPNADFGGTFTDNLADENRTALNVVWYDTEDTDADGELFTVSFAVDDGASFGTKSAVTLTYGAQDICDTAGDYKAVYVKNGSVTVADPLPGDVYEDGVITVYDLTLLARYITGLEAFDARQKTAGDVNNDTFTDIKDVVKLSQYLAGFSNAELLETLSGMTAQLRLGNIVTDAAGTALVPVTVRNNPGFAGFRFVLEYDADALEVLDIIPSELLTASDFRTNLGHETENGNTDGLIVSWYQNENLTDDGVLFTVKVRLKDADAAKLAIRADENALCSSAVETVPASYSDGYALREAYVAAHEQTDDGCVTTLYFDDSSEERTAAVVTAYYDENGRLLRTGCHEVLLHPGAVTITDPKTAYDGVKCFVFGSLSDMKPMMPAK